MTSNYDVEAKIASVMAVATTGICWAFLIGLLAV